MGVAHIVALLCGLAAWTLGEYALHRWGFHHARTDPLTSLVAREHRIHHREPLRTSRGLRFMAWLAVGASAAPLLLINGTAWALWIGWWLGYTVYDRIHWRAHHRSSPNRYESWVRAGHHQHHYGAPRLNYGVTSAIWDHVFGTRVPRSTRLSDSSPT